MRNLDEFHEVFGTAEGDGLWVAPGERVRIWSRQLTSRGDDPDPWGRGERRAGDGRTTSSTESTPSDQATACPWSLTKLTETWSASLWASQ